MFITFHTDPIDLGALDDDLRRYGFAYLDTLRTNAHRIEKSLANKGSDGICLAVPGPDGDFHYFLMSQSVADYDETINDRVLQAILDWNADGSPVPSMRPLLP